MSIDVDTRTLTEQLADMIWNWVPGNDEEACPVAAKKILEHYIVIDRRELPEVTAGKCWGDLKVGNRGVTYAKDTDADIVHTNALETIAMWKHLEAVETAETISANTRNKRRDELASELFNPQGVRVYGHLSNEAKRAIDRIITLEDAASHE